MDDGDCRGMSDEPSAKSSRKERSMELICIALWECTNFRTST